jgi:hypothetical protein
MDAVITVPGLSRRSLRFTAKRLKKVADGQRSANYRLLSRILSGLIAGISTAHVRAPDFAALGVSNLRTSFLARMKSEAAKETYLRRGTVADFPNAFCRNHELSPFRVRGRLKVVLAHSLRHALAYNFQRFRNLCVPETQQSYLEFLNNH